MCKISGVEVVNHQIDLCDLDALRSFFGNHDIAGIIHFAAYKTVPESVKRPLLYFDNNLFSLINLLKCASEFEVSNFVFSSSCSIYGNPDHLPVTENTPFGKAESPYARTKQMGEQILEDYNKANPLNISILRYFNPVGAHESALIGDLPTGVPDNLVPYITQTGIGTRASLSIFGGDYPTRDGTCIRDYIHVVDIADAHIMALKYLEQSSTNGCFDIFNLGTGDGVTVLEVVNAFESATKLKLNYSIVDRRPGDVVSIYANNEKALKLLKWKPKHNLESMMLSAWNWELYLKERQ